MEPLVRYGEPGKYDIAPQGHTCKQVVPGSDRYALYMQISSDSDTPRWERVGEYDGGTPQAHIDEDLRSTRLLCK